MAIFQKSSVEPLRLQRGRHQVALADRGAADGQEDIGGFARTGQRHDALERVLGDAQRHRFAAMGLDQRGNAKRDRRYDLIRRKLGAGGHDLVAGGEDRDFGPPPDRQFGMVHGGGEHQLARAEPGPGREQDLALGKVLTARADMRDGA